MLIGLLRGLGLRRPKRRDGENPRFLLGSVGLSSNPSSPGGEKCLVSLQARLI